MSLSRPPRNPTNLTRIPLDQCIRGRAYRLRSRNLVVGIYDGEGGFIGIRRKFDYRYLFTEYHWDYSPTCGTVHSQEDLGIDVPSDVELKTSLGTQDQKTGCRVRFDKPRGDGGRGWVYVDTDEPCPLNSRGIQDVLPMSIPNKPLFAFLAQLEIEETS